MGVEGAAPTINYAAIEEAEEQALVARERVTRLKHEALLALGWTIQKRKYMATQGRFAGREREVYVSPCGRYRRMYAYEAFEMVRRAARRPKPFR